MKVNFLSEYEILSGFLNMEKDLSMLNFAIENKSEDFFVRFYGWKPKCVSLGRYQKEFNPPFEIDVVRRPTGGRALLHDDEITYCIVGKIPFGFGVTDTYKVVSNILIKGFSNLGLNLSLGGEKAGKNNYCMNISTGADICYKGKKLIGSAQFRKEGYFLQHGSILKSLDYNLVEKLFCEPVSKDKIVTLSDIAPNLKDEEIIASIKNELLSAALI